MTDVPGDIVSLTFRQSFELAPFISLRPIFAGAEDSPTMSIDIEREEASRLDPTLPTVEKFEEPKRGLHPVFFIMLVTNPLDAVPAQLMR